jgi:hypothetical protein
MIRENKYMKEMRWSISRGKEVKDKAIPETGRGGP